MNIKFENPDKINGLMTITVEENDYKEKVEKSLKDYRKKANIPGFRPGMVPMGLIKKQFGTAAKMDAINHLVGEEMYKYINDNKIQMLGEPLPSEKQAPQDLEKEPPYEFIFDVAVAPEINLELTNKDKVNYYKIKVDDKLIDEHVNMYANRSGNYEKAEEYQDNDLLKGDLRELDVDGNTKDGGLTVEEAVVFPKYIKVEDQQKLFEGAKLGDIITINPRKMYQESDAELASFLKIDKEQAKDVVADFSYQITEISRFTPAKVDQKLFDQVYGEGNIKDEKDFREHIAAEISKQNEANSDWRFLQDVREYCEKKVGELTFPEELLKRVMMNNNKDKGAEYVENNFADSIKYLKWHLIKEQLVAQTNIKIEDADVKAVAKDAARMQFAQYGMANVPDEYIENYADEMLKKRENVEPMVDRAIDIKLISALKELVKLNEKSVSVEEFNKLATAE